LSKVKLRGPTGKDPKIKLIPLEIVFKDEKTTPLGSVLGFAAIHRLQETLTTSTVLEDNL
jgi:hypothetical protein